MYPQTGASARGPTYKVDFNWFGESFSILGNAAGVWVGSLIIYGIIYLLSFVAASALFPAPAGSNSSSSDLSDVGAEILFPLIWVGGCFAWASYSRLAVKQVRGEPVGFADAFSGGSLIGKFLLLSIVMVVGEIIGVLCLIFGVFVTTAFLTPAAALLADDESFGSAISRSIDGVRNDWFAAGLFSFVLWLITQVSSVCVIGLLATIPMYFIIQALMYRDMVGMPGVITFGPSYGYGAPPPGVWPTPPSVGPQNSPPPGWPQPPSPSQGAAWAPEAAPPSPWPAQNVPPPFGQAPRIPRGPLVPPNDPNRPLS